MTVRLAGPDDTESVIRLVSSLLVELGADPLPERASAAYDALLGGSGFAMLAEVSGSDAAVCTVSYVDAIRTLGRYAVIQEMYVASSLRGTGIGRELLEAALAESVARGCAIVELGTPAHGERQIRFYARSGFVSVGERLRWRPSVD